MNNELRQLVSERLDRAPATLQAYLRDQLTQEVNLVAQIYDLLNYEAFLENLTLLTLLGLNNPEDMAEQIAETTNIDEDLALSLSVEITNQILAPHARATIQILTLADEEVGIENDVPVPKPPEVVSPKVRQHIENIRPKPAQGIDDPYREAVD